MICRIQIRVIMYFATVHIYFSLKQSFQQVTDLPGGKTISVRIACFAHFFICVPIVEKFFKAVVDCFPGSAYEL